MGVETLLMAAAIGGAVTSAGGALAKGQADNAKYQADSQASLYNAQAANNRAAQARDAASAEGQDFFRKGMMTVASGQASRGAAGVTNEGSPLLVDAATVREVALGAARKVSSGDQAATVYGNEATLDTAKSKYDLQAGETAIDTSYLNAASSLMTSAGKMYGKGG